jgi:alkanesulfonate monooxygenase
LSRLPLQQPHPPLFFGGASPGALEMGARLCDVYAIYAEPLASTRERITQFRAQAAAFGRVPGFNVSVRPIIADTEGAAWDKANRILGAMNKAKGWRRQEEATGPVDNAGKRLMGFALESDIYDGRLWMPIAKATGALGNTSCLVGTPEQSPNRSLNTTGWESTRFSSAASILSTMRPISAENSSPVSRPAPPRSTV